MHLSLKGLQAFAAKSYAAKVREYYAASVSMESLPPDTPKRKLLDQVRDAIRLKHYSYRTEQSEAASKIRATSALTRIVIVLVSIAVI